jgi:hypothetical protein
MPRRWGVRQSPGADRTSGVPEEMIVNRDAATILGIPALEGKKDIPFE